MKFLKVLTLAAPGFALEQRLVNYIGNYKGDDLDASGLYEYLDKLDNT